MTLESSEGESQFFVFSLVSLSVNPPEKVSALFYFGWAFLLLPLTAEELQQFDLTGWRNLLFAFSSISSALWYYHNNEKGLKGWERFVRFRKVSELETKFTSIKEVTATWTGSWFFPTMDCPGDHPRGCYWMASQNWHQLLLAIQSHTPDVALSPWKNIVSYSHGQPTLFLGWYIQIAFCMEKTLIFSLFSKYTEEQRCFPKVCLMHCPQSRWSKDAIVITEKSGMKNKAREPNNKLDTMWSERCQKQSWEFLPFWV